VWFYPRDALISVATLVGVGRVKITALSCSAVCVLHGFFLRADWTVEVEQHALIDALGLTSDFLPPLPSAHTHATQQTK
jgi:hypothetical protein